MTDATQPGDAGTTEAGSIDAGSIDARTAHAGFEDKGTADAGSADAGTPDAGTGDAGSDRPAPHASHRRAARSFDAAAEVYEASRPDYPGDAVDWMVPTGARTALDVGAGTGKLTSALVTRGLDVVAVDPSADMLAVLERVVPGARAAVGEAEALPVGDGSVDLVTAAQAWHWVDPVRAGAEAARVLVPGGRLALVWNIRDERLEWLRRLGEIAGSERSYRDLGEEPLVGDAFGAIEYARFPWSRFMTLDEVLDLVRSRSWYLTADAADRERMIAGVTELVAGAAEDGRVEMAYITEVFRTHRR